MRLPSRLISSIWVPPLSGPAFGCGAFVATPPKRTEQVNFGLNGSLTSYWRNWPVPKHAAYRYLSSVLSAISVTSGGTALNALSAGGNSAGSAGSAGISITFRTVQSPFSRCHIQIDADRSLVDITTQTKPYGRAGAGAGGHSRT